MATSVEPKLPTKQLAILAVARFAEPLALTSVFPYLPEMIKSFGVPQTDVAWWAGVTSFVFSLAQSATAVPWGRLSDRIGRKWTIVIGLVSTMVTFLVWGVSSSLPMAIVVRAIQGGGNGNVGIIRTMVAEMVPERELQPRAFSIMPLVWSIGSIFGPAFGGFFAGPAERFPSSIFGRIAFFRDYPYALPNMIAALFFLVSVSTAVLFLHETLEARRSRRDVGLVLGRRLTRGWRRRRGAAASPPSRRRSFVDGEATAPLLPTVPGRSRRRGAGAKRGGYGAPPKPAVPVGPPALREVFTRQTAVTLVAYTFLALHSVSYDQLLSVFLNHPVRERGGAGVHLPFRFDGGFGLSHGEIGTIFMLYGIVCGLIQFVVFPPLCHRWGVLNCYKACAIVFPVIYFATPYTVIFDDPKLRFASLFVIMLVKSFSVIFGFPCVTILLTNSAPSLRVLGTLNGFATTFSAVGRAVGPALSGAAFTWGVRAGYVVPAWWLLALVAAVGIVPSFMMVEGAGPSGAVASSSSSSSLTADGESDDDDEEDDETTALLRDSAVVLDSDEEDEDKDLREADEVAFMPPLARVRSQNVASRS